MKAPALRPLVGSLRQYASVRRIVLDDGGERGVRALAFTTGGGLDFWAMADRALDIGPLSYRGTPLAWAAPHGFRAPSLHIPGDDSGYGFDRSYSGLLATGGLDHIRHPTEKHPHHGRIAMTPARITSYGENWDAAEQILFCEGEILQSRFGGEALLLRRRIEAPIGGCELRITDLVENVGADRSDLALLYHMNFGFPGIGDETSVQLDGKSIGPALQFGHAAAAPGVDCYHAPASAECILRVPLADGGERSISISFDPKTLPFVQVYRNLRRNNGLLAIEPCTSERLEAGRSGPGPSLEPGETRAFGIRLKVTGSGGDARAT